MFNERKIKIFSMVINNLEMKKFVLLFGCVCFCLSVFAQTNFQDISFSEALKKAKEENKMVFVDCYTSWCGPCKYMADKGRGYRQQV